MISHWIKASDGAEYPIRFSQGVGIQLAIAEGIPANMVQKFLSSFNTWPLGRVYRFYFLAFRSGAKKEGVEFNMDEDDFIEWISEDDTIFPQIMKSNLASQPDEVVKKNTARVQRLPVRK